MRRKVTITLVAIAIIGSGLVWFDIGTSAETLLQTNRITIRTENYPRPPYSGATYYIYEREGEAICTKLEICNKFNNCSTSYTKGAFKEEEDIETGEPYGKTDAVVIPASKLKKHVCLKRFGLLKK